MSVYLHFDGMTAPNPDDPTEIEWRLRYGKLTQRDRYLAASFISVYKQLVNDTQKRRNEKVSGLRKARDAARVES